MRIPVPDADRIELEKPSPTLDTNLMALRPPAKWPAGLLNFEWNYFGTRQVELCVTPQTPAEILQGQPVTSVGSTAYARFQKSALFKARPPGTVLTFTEQEADDLWLRLGTTLFPSVDPGVLLPTQRGDVTQVFYHLTFAGSLTNAPFVTVDHHFLGCRDDLRRQFGIEVMTPDEAWQQYQPRYGLTVPSEQQAEELSRQQHAYFRRLRENTFGVYLENT